MESKYRKVFREHIILVTEGRLLMLMYLWGLILLFKLFFLSGFVTWFCVVFLFFAALASFNIYYFWYRCFGKLIVTREHITWRCLFMKTHRLTIDQCRYAGTETFTKGNIVKDRLGTGFCSVYVSTEPFPREYSGRIDKLRNTDTFIKFPISPGLCEALSQVLPDPQNRVFIAYHQESERQKRIREREKEKRKQKRKKV